MNNPVKNENIDVCYVKDYIPQNIYKTLVKCVIGLIGNEHLASFEKTIDWIRYKKDYIELPKVVLTESKRLILEPELYIFTRKKLDNFSIPYSYGELRVLDTIFIFIVPFTEKDKYDFANENECKSFMKILNATYGNYIVEDFSSLVPQKIEEQLLVNKSNI